MLRGENMNRGELTPMVSVLSRVAKYVVIVGTAALFVGCGQKLQTIKNKRSDGVLVQVSDKSLSDIQSLFPKNKVRVINQEDGIYRIQGAEFADAKSKLPNGHIEEDFYLNIIPPRVDVNEISSLETISSIGDDIRNLECKKSLRATEGDIFLVNKPQFVTSGVVEVGSSPISLLAQVAANRAQDWNPTNFLSNPLEGINVGTSAPRIEFHWVVSAPPGSQSTAFVNGNMVSVNPDRPGEYAIILITQEVETKNCTLASVRLGATWNQPYKQSIPDHAGTYVASKFFHDPIVRADQAWKESQGEGVTIAVIDSGINYNHPDLHENIKINRNEIPDNGIDDDGNGLIDDVYGWDFGLDDKYPFDDESHGTHVSGLIAAENFGVAKKAKILPIKAILPTGSATSGSIVSSIYYAIKQKADIINMSLGGGGETSAILLAALKKAQQAGILVVVAAGNEKTDTDAVATHFTAKDGSNVLCVSATDEFDALTSYSNYGFKNVDLAAPGGTEDNPIMSTYAFTDLGQYIAYPGTSMATPIVAGAAALVKSVNHNLSPEQIKAILVHTGRDVSGLSTKINSGKVLDAAAAVHAAKGAPLFISAGN